MANNLDVAITWLNLHYLSPNPRFVKKEDVVQYSKVWTKYDSLEEAMIACIALSQKQYPSRLGTNLQITKENLDEAIDELLSSKYGGISSSSNSQGMLISLLSEPSQLFRRIIRKITKNGYSSADFFNCLYSWYW